MEVRTLKEWRELRGFIREELAEKVGVSARVIARLEEVGDPSNPDTIEGDAFLNAVIGPIMEALGLEEGVLIEEVPKNAEPGNFVLDLGALEELDEGVARFLVEHAEEVDLRIAVPNAWDVGLKRYKDVSEADQAEILSYLRRQVAHLEATAAEAEKTNIRAPSPGPMPHASLDPDAGPPSPALVMFNLPGVAGRHKSNNTRRKYAEVANPSWKPPSREAAGHSLGAGSPTVGLSSRSAAPFAS